MLVNFHHKWNAQPRMQTLHAPVTHANAVLCTTTSAVVNLVLWSYPVRNVIRNSTKQTSVKRAKCARGSFSFAQGPAGPPSQSTSCWRKRLLCLNRAVKRSLYTGQLTRLIYFWMIFQSCIVQVDAQMLHGLCRLLTDRRLYVTCHTWRSRAVP
jgi:hypothetical protein